MTLRQSKRRDLVAQSEIRAMTQECTRVNGINMAQGVCDLEVPACVIQGAKDAMDAGINTYTPCAGMPEMLNAIARKVGRTSGLDIDPESEIVVSNGATGAFYCTCLSLLDPGDEVILFEPYYGYHRSTLTAIDCRPVYVRLDPPQWILTRDMLEAVRTERTRAIVLNTPANPSGKVFSRTELQIVADFAQEHDVIVFTDEIYEHFVYDDHTHTAPAIIPGMRERTIMISGLSKVFSITGWRLGYAICPPDVRQTAAHFNDLVYVCAPSPLQVGAARGLLELGNDYYESIVADHRIKRDLFCNALHEAALTPYIPQGAYYVLADVSRLPGADDKARVMHILNTTGIASVPGRAFYHDDAGHNLARFCFAKEQHIIDDACERLKRLG
jgi:aminotransferase